MNFAFSEEQLFIRDQAHKFSAPGVHAQRGAWCAGLRNNFVRLETVAKNCRPGLDCHDQPIAEDPIVRERLATWYSQYARLQAANKRMITAVTKGGIAGAKASLGLPQAPRADKGMAFQDIPSGAN